MDISTAMLNPEDWEEIVKDLEAEGSRLRAEIDYRDRALIRMAAVNDDLMKALDAALNCENASWVAKAKAALARARGKG